MKFFKSIFIVMTLLMVCNAGVLASSDPTQTKMPTQYLGPNGELATPPSPIQAMPAKGENGTVTIAASTSNNWYWAGADASPTDDNKQNILLTIQALEITGNSGSVNIVVGPGSDITNTNNTKGVAAEITSGGLTIPPGVKVNIYQSANASFNKQNCFFVIRGSSTTKVPTETTSSTVTVNGELNVYSGALQAVASSTGTTIPVQIGANGNLNIDTYGSLEADAVAQSVDDSQSTTPGQAINILSGGKFNIGGEVACTGGSATKTANGTVGGVLTGLSINGGFLMAGNTYEAIQSNCKNGLLMTTVNDNDISIYTAFGESNMRLNVFTLGQMVNGNFTEPVELGTGETFTVVEGANFSFPGYIEGYEFNFGSGSKLTIQPGATLTIPNETSISMDDGSELTNNGQIIVEPPQVPAS